MLLCSPKMQKVSEWYENDYLLNAFNVGLDVSDTSTPDFFFQHIYAPVLLATASGQPAAPVWKDFGFSDAEVTAAYWAEFSGNYFPEYFASRADFDAAVNSNACKVVKLIKATLSRYKKKYLGMIELAGFYYNPIYNTDWAEEHGLAEIHSDETRSRSQKVTTTDSRTPYDSTNFKPAAKSEVSGAAADNEEKTTHAQTAPGVTSDKDAFGNGAGATDSYHMERTHRAGNIGVMSTQQLIRQQVEVLRIDLLGEFFKDLNEVLLIPIF